MLCLVDHISVVTLSLKLHQQQHSSFRVDQMHRSETAVGQNPRRKMAPKLTRMDATYKCMPLT